jgi:DNA repair protein RadD
MKTLRIDQTAAIDNLRNVVRKETRRPVLQAPTGFGKTVVAADIIRSAREKNNRALITVPALSLVDQTVEALYAHGIQDIGVVQASHMMTNLSKPVQVCSVQTLMRREIPDTDVVLIDEVHRWFHFFESWFAGEKWRKIPIIGLSATPWFKGLGAYFDKLIVGNTIDQMIKDKTLAPFRVFAASHPDLDGVRSSRNTHGDLDFVESDLADRMNRPKLVADAVEAWKQWAEDRPTICFAVNRDHAAQLAKEFEQAGIPSGYMDCETPALERREIRRRFLNGDVRVVCNVDVIGLGVDWPEVSCISYCRPTRSEMRYVQNIGRGLRVQNGKADLIIIDHSDTTLRLGFVNDIHHEELDDGQPKINGAKAMEKPVECPACHYLKAPRTMVCPACGHKVEHHAKPIVVERGTLRELKPEDLKPKEMPSAKKFPNKHQTYGQFMWYQQQHGKSPKWATANYKQLYGVWPREAVMGMWRQYFKAPDMELASWIQSRRIAWAKSRGNRWGNGNGNGNVRNGNGHAHRDDDGTVGGRTQAVVDRASEFVKGTLMTEQDFEDFK